MLWDTAFEQPEYVAEYDYYHWETIEGVQPQIVEALLRIGSRYIVDHQTIKADDLGWKSHDVPLVIQNRLYQVRPSKFDRWDRLKNLEVV